MELLVWPGTRRVVLLSRWPLGRPRPGHGVSSCPPARLSQKVDSTALPDCLGLPDPQLRAKGGKSARKRNRKLNCTVFVIRQVYMTMTFCPTEQESSGVGHYWTTVLFFLSRPAPTFPSSRFFLQFPPLLYSTFYRMSRAAACSCASERCQGGCGDPQMVRVVPTQRELGQVPFPD